MSYISRKDTANKIDSEIARIYEEMEVEMPGTSRYADLIGNLERLERLKKEINQPSVDPNKLIMVGANLAGIVTVLSYERVHVIGSKAFGLILKMK